MLTDTHCHLNLAKFDIDRDLVVERAAAAGVGRLLIPGLDAASSQQAVELARGRSHIFAAVGFHPTDIEKLDQGALYGIRQLAADAKVVAIGEIGLDYYWVTDSGKRERQREGLRTQLNLAGELDKPVILHMREQNDAEYGACSDDLIAILEEWTASLQRGAHPLAGAPGVLHSFSGSPAIAGRALELGFYIGVTGPVTYKNAAQRRQVIAGLPLERLLVETDAPFLAPDPHRGRRNEPAFVTHIADKIAEIQSRTPQEVAAVTSHNAARHFRVGRNCLNTVTFLSPVQAQLQLVEARLHAQAGDRHPDLRAALEQILAAGGKRIRPTLGLLVGNMLGAPEDKLVTLGAAVELLHTATLVHDDLIDGSLLRRGMPTLNARWSPAATVLTGDFLFARAAKLAAETDHLALMNLFAETLAIIVNGELNQMFSSRGVINRDNYYQRIYAKTASLFEMTSRAAAMISPASAATMETMREFGFETGIAFQIVDDILDFTGEQTTMGKPIGSDLLNGLVTLPAIYYAEARPDDADVKSLSEGGWANQERMSRLVESIRNTDAVNKAMGEANRHVELALRTLGAFESGPERDALENLAKFIVDRNV